MLFHWNEAEARERASRLRDFGHEVVRPRFTSGADFKSITARPPDAFVIDLSRLPSHGREVAGYLRERKATRRVPLVFVDGDPDKVERIRRLLPDATYTGWARLRGDLRRALRRPLADPVVPGPMAGYAAAPLAQKLAIKPGTRVALRGAPRGFARVLGKLPQGARVARGARSADVTLLFVKSRAALVRALPGAVRALRDRQALWICWPKQASGAGTDLTQQVVRDAGLASGIVDYKICAIDATWSGLLFARRRG